METHPVAEPGGAGDHHHAVFRGLRRRDRLAIMARVSDDHANESYCVEHMSSSSAKSRPRLISRAEVKQHSGEAGSFWAVVDGFVVDATEFVDTHPGGLRKLLSSDSPSAGATGQPFGFSFSRGKNAHFPDTGKRFQKGVKQYLSCGNGEPYLPPADVAFPPHGKVVILGRLES